MSTVDSFGTQEMAAALGALVGMFGYVAFILRPAWSSYGRPWEKLAASFLTLYMLVTLVAVGAALGLLVVFSYDRFV